ncbi:toprim domain-containing protein [Halalkalibacterium halodurans]|uniref:toprim domain-containing protein n=1 Tax=Halalkalibacterium halodurans TaxID=86665 RepID=UPI002E1AC2FC|nr:toprim domain-containing protein [Halalkalibacterium halodurans]
MGSVTVDGKELSIDVREELEGFDWRNAKWLDDKLIASSPFRYDKSPSFFVNLSSGGWADSGAYDEEWASGNLPKLLSFLRNETYEETVDYLREKYDYEYSEEARINVDFPTLTRRIRAVVPPQKYRGKPLDTNYLIERGIHRKVIELQGVFDGGNCVGIPWRNADGDVLNIKYRMKRGKTFWYERNATPISRMVYGLDTVIKRRIKDVVICEAEIDAMTWQSAGIYAIAVGGTSFNKYQADMIVQAGVETVTPGGDNDEAGRLFNRRVERLLGDYVYLRHIDYAGFRGCKDANELGASRLREIKRNRRSITPVFSK